MENARRAPTLIAFCFCTGLWKQCHRMLHLLAGPPWHGELHPQTVIPNKDASSPSITSLTWWPTPSNHYPEQGCFVPYLDFSDMVGYNCKPLSWTNISFFKSLLSGIFYYSHRKILNTENENLAWGCCSDEPDSIVVRSSGFICCKKHVEEFEILGRTCPHIHIQKSLVGYRFGREDCWDEYRQSRPGVSEDIVSTRTWRLLWDIFW